MEHDKEEETLIDSKVVDEWLLNGVGVVGGTEWWEILIGVTLFVCVTAVFVVCVRRSDKGDDEEIGTVHCVVGTDNVDDSK